MSVLGTSAHESSTRDFLAALHVCLCMMRAIATTSRTAAAVLLSASALASGMAPGIRNQLLVEPCDAEAESDDRVNDLSIAIRRVRSTDLLGSHELYYEAFYLIPRDSKQAIIGQLVSLISEGAMMMWITWEELDAMIDELQSHFTIASGSSAYISPDLVNAEHSRNYVRVFDGGEFAFQYFFDGHGRVTTGSSARSPAFNASYDFENSQLSLMPPAMRIRTLTIDTLCRPLGWGDRFLGGATELLGRISLTEMADGSDQFLLTIAPNGNLSDNVAYPGGALLGWDANDGVCTFMRTPLMPQNGQAQAVRIQVDPVTLIPLRGVWISMGPNELDLARWSFVEGRGGGLDHRFLLPGDARVFDFRSRSTRYLGPVAHIADEELLQWMGAGSVHSGIVSSVVPGASVGPSLEGDAGTHYQAKKMFHLLTGLASVAVLVWLVSARMRRDRTRG